MASWDCEMHLHNAIKDETDLMDGKFKRFKPYHIHQPTRGPTIIMIARPKVYLIIDLSPGKSMDWGQRRCITNFVDDSDQRWKWEFGYLCMRTDRDTEHLTPDHRIFEEFGLGDDFRRFLDWTIHMINEWTAIKDLPQTREGWEREIARFKADAEPYFYRPPMIKSACKTV